MAEGTYEYECMRAELLGIAKPDYEEWMKKQEEVVAVEEEEHDVEKLKETGDESEQMTHISGGLDELNNILKNTQRKINRFKASCGSLTNLIKFKIGVTSSASSESVESNVKTETNGTTVSETTPNAEDSHNVVDVDNTDARKSDLAKALDNHNDKLDSLIEKAENAQYAMSHQNKEMKRFLR